MSKFIPSRNTIASGVLVVIVLAAVFPFVAFAVPQVVGADHSYVVVSSSMRPTFDAGDVIFVEEVPSESIEVGDVITYREGTTEVIENGEIDFVTHRVTEVIETGDGRMFQTKGDANDTPDRQAVAPSDVLGEVRFHVPYMGHVIAFATTDMGFLTMVVVPLGLLILGECYDLATAVRRNQTGLRGILGGSEEDE